MKHNKGFTLIELMIVVAIIGIIAMFALPSYQNAQRKARITEALAQMTELQSQIEKARLEGRVPYNTIELHVSKNGKDGTKYYIRHNQKIQYSNKDIYNITYTAATTEADKKNGIKYRINAAAIGSWIDSNHDCSSLSMTNSGTITPSTCPK